MEFLSFVADGKNYKRAYTLLKEAEQFEKCADLVEDILFEPKGDYRGNTFLEARKSNGELCGIAIYKWEEDHLYLKIICSNCKGTGKQIMKELIALTKREGKPMIRLFSTPSATGFYETMGFTLPPGETVKNWGQPMELSVANNTPATGGNRKKTQKRNRRKTRRT